MPGGKVRQLEGLPSAAKRELDEETKLDVLEENLEYMESFNVRYPDFDFVYHVFRTVFTPRLNVVIDNNDNKEYRFMLPMEALGLKLTPPLGDVIRKIYKL